MVLCSRCGRLDAGLLDPTRLSIGRGGSIARSLLWRSSAGQEAQPRRLWKSAPRSNTPSHGRQTVSPVGFSLGAPPDVMLTQREQTPFQPAFNRLSGSLHSHSTTSAVTLPTRTLSNLCWRCSPLPRYRGTTPRCRRALKAWLQASRRKCTRIRSWSRRGRKRHLRGRYW